MSDKDIINVLFKPTNTTLVLNVGYYMDDIVFIQNHFECGCDDDFIHHTEKEPVCPRCGADHSEHPDARLSDWFQLNGLGILSQGKDGLREFLNREDVQILSPVSDDIC